MNCRYLQMNWRYLQLNWRYLQIESICRYLQLICRYLQLNCRYLQFIWRYLQFIWRYLQFIWRYLQLSRFEDIYNWIADMCTSIGDIFNSVNKCENGAPYVYPCVCTLFSCVSERKDPTMTSYSRIPQLPPSDFVPFAAWIATWSDSVCRIRSHSQPHDKSHAVSGHMESPSSVYMLFDFCRITHNACRLRLPRIWNLSVTPYPPHLILTMQSYSSASRPSFSLFSIQPHVSW